MHLNVRMIGGGIAAVVATGVGYLLLARGEQPSFRTVSREGAFSVRDYPRLWVAETVIEGCANPRSQSGWASLPPICSGAAALRG